MLFDNALPRYLPHLKHPGVLSMGLSPLREGAWIETDNQLAGYHRHKLDFRRRHGDRAYRGTASSMPAQRELSQRLLDYLTTAQADLYRREAGQLHCLAGEYRADIDSDEPLWACSLWVADDLVLMAEIDGEYCLTAASLCSPSHWRLEDKFGQPLRQIHDPIPGFHRVLTPGIDRFFHHLRPGHPVVRCNWSLQACPDLGRRPAHEVPVDRETALYYRTERQSLMRLPVSGAIAFTIRVYLHPLETLHHFPGAMRALFDAIDAAPLPLAQYKNFIGLAPALARYRDAL